MAQELRNEQDVAYFESLERDRQKEAERQRLMEEAKKEEEMKLKKQNDKIRKLEVRIWFHEESSPNFASDIKGILKSSENDCFYVNFRGNRS